MEYNSEGIERLRNAIIEKTLDDYINALKGHGYDRRDPRYVIGEVEHWIKKGDFRVFSEDVADGDKVIKVTRERAIDQLEKEIKETEKKIQKKKNKIIKLDETAMDHQEREEKVAKLMEDIGYLKHNILVKKAHIKEIKNM